MTAQIYIVLKSFDVPKSELLEKTRLQVVEKVTHFLPSGTNEAPSDLSRSRIEKYVPTGHRKTDVHSLNWIRLPKSHTLYTVLQSPHIDKKSREQFEMKIHKQLIVLKKNTKQLRYTLSRLKFHDLSGVQLKVTLNYKTRLNR